MLHGFMGTTQSHFSNQISYLEGRYELIKMDLPGHGDSTIEPSENYIEDTLEYLYTRMKEEGEGYILGLSLGASLAIHIALRKPELVKGIVLTGYSPFIPEELKDIMEKQNEYFLNIEKTMQKSLIIFINYMEKNGRKPLEKYSIR
jgi:pimeloyl-ACP methyl ester carboxylesterase